MSIGSSSFHGLPVNKRHQGHKPPAHWPKHLRYLASSVFHTSVSTILRTHIGRTLDANKDFSYENAKHPKVVIRPIATDLHPAKGQFGLFAAQRIPPKTHILDYIGELHCDDRPDSNYDLCLCRLPDGVSVGIDASTMGNEARFVNDYRGIRGKPNAIFLDGRTPAGELRMSVWSSSEDIKKGEEILVSYGKSWWRSRVPENILEA
ncbi:hypothetical protein CPB84DRAFT_1786554 [Gymnopilus junonius]|uniref:SET domain-containing protein n=1 Tax=Gymnopilus junonius TaxID=109634 RepID=A0A9P5TL34_GYMJU|nr:hypothetical protein CPB84DRAFT_1786554 [Gymnopilus junonius]